MCGSRRKSPPPFSDSPPCRDAAILRNSPMAPRRVDVRRFPDYPGSLGISCDGICFTNNCSILRPQGIFAEIRTSAPHERQLAHERLVVQSQQHMSGQSRGNFFRSIDASTAVRPEPATVVSCGERASRGLREERRRTASARGLTEVVKLSSRY